MESWGGEEGEDEIEYHNNSTLLAMQTMTHAHAHSPSAQAAPPCSAANMKVPDPQQALTTPQLLASSSLLKGKVLECRVPFSFSMPAD